MNRVDRVMLKELLARVGVYPSTGEVRSWSHREAGLAVRWAASEYTGDGREALAKALSGAGMQPPTIRLPRPGFLDPFVARPGEKESDVYKRMRASEGRIRG